MLAYHESIKDFKSDVIKNNVVKKMNERLKVGQSEFNSWSSTIFFMYSILSSLDIDDNVEVGMELKIPLGNSRIDFLLCGVDKDGENKLIIIELKQWSNVLPSYKENLVVVPNYLHQDFVHPSYQAYSYKLSLEALNETIESNKIAINSSSCLFNLIDDSGIKDARYADILSKSPVFTQNDNDKLAEFIKKHIKCGSKTKNLLYLIDEGKIKPSTMLIESLKDALTNNDNFTLLDKQQVAYANILDIINKPTKQKKVIICKGGAGTGKSLIAIKLLANLIENGKNAFYVTKNSAVRECYEKYLRGRENIHLRSLFLGSISISKNRPIDEYDCLLIDEAHRLPERSKAGNILLGTNLIKEIINATACSVFFIDSKQVVDIRDYATVENITRIAIEQKAIVYSNQNLELEAQFRCSGNDDYIRWIESILYNQSRTLYIEKERFDFEIEVFDSFTQLYNKISLLSKTSSNARIVSGDVFPWISRDDPNAFDIEIEGIKLQWNKDARYVVDSSQLNRVGHIDTVQGMEFEYVGLIVGNDLLFRNGKVLTDYKTHPAGAGHFRRHSRRTPLGEDLELIDTIIRNTYNVLFTRPTKGIFIYCQDKELGTYLKQQVEYYFK